jgi:ankyrin repeat protein
LPQSPTESRIDIVRKFCPLNLIATLLALSSFSPVQASEPSKIFELIKAGDQQQFLALLKNDSSALDVRNEQGISPLLYAAYLERSAMVDALRAQNPTLDFYEACVVGDLKRVQQLLARGQDVDVRSPDGFTPLGLSIFFKQPEVARILIDAGAALDAKASNTLQVAPIHAAVARSDLASLQLLLTHGADPDLTQQRLMRPIHEAAAAGNLPIVAMLLMFGADPQARNEERKTAADFARELGHLAIAERLENLK